MSQKWNSGKIIKFLEAYEQCPCLWDVHSNSYKNKFAREAAYLKMAKKVNIENFTVANVKAKIRSIRNAYTLELTKISKSKKSEADTDEVYKPRVPWFTVADRILHQVVQRRESQSTEIDNAVKVEDEHEKSNSQDVSTSILPASPINPNKRKKIESTIENDLIYQKKDVLTLSKEDDQYDIFGKYVASEMRNLSSEYLRKKLKRQFQRVIMEIYEEEERLSSRSSNSTLSNNNNS